MWLTFMIIIILLFAQSAVKAKLIELGTGGSTGYIDDELPDYVMIMVANKRSKQQMTEDLNLFLGANTAEFVNWLHQVLQKLQEVAIPAVAVVATTTKSKRKPIEEQRSNKDKKDKKKKLKRSHKSKSDEAAAVGDGSTSPLAPPPPPAAAPPPPPPPPPTSITDVFADHLMQKVRTNAEKTIVVKGKKEPISADMAAAASALVDGEENAGGGGGAAKDDFDIPTISEIAENAVVTVNRRKEISALADLQRRINQAKRQLKALGTAEDDESADEDCIDIKDDAEEEELGSADDDDEDDDGGGDAKNLDETTRPQQHVPITFRTEQQMAASSKRNRAEQPPASTNKRSVMDRLGSRSEGADQPMLAPPPSEKSNIVSLSAHRRSEKEIYVPVFRRKDDDRRSERDLASTRNLDRSKDRRRDDRPAAASRDDRSIDRRNDRSAVRDLRDRVKERASERATVQRGGASKRSFDDDAPPTMKKAELAKKRVVESRVFVAPPKPEYVEDVIEVPVNSVVKVQPRPLIPSNQQASKNLLLRAVAEAQKSTALVRPRVAPAAVSGAAASTSTDRSPKYFTKSFRNHQKNSGSGTLQNKQNIVIEVLRTADDDVDEHQQTDEIEFGSESEEYVYVPVNVAGAGNSDDDDNVDDDDVHNVYVEDGGGAESKVQPQFVVTLDDSETQKKYAQLASSSTRHKQQQQLLGLNKKHQLREKRSNGNVVAAAASAASPSKTSSPLTVEQPLTKVNKLIIQNDTEDEEELRKEVVDDENNSGGFAVNDKLVAASSASKSPSPAPPPQQHRRNQKRRHVSPIKFDLKSEELSESKRPKPDEVDEKRNTKDRATAEPIRLTTKRTDVSRKYDNLPPRKFRFFVIHFKTKIFNLKENPNWF